MKYRILGKTGIEVSEIGFGAWGIGKGMWKGAKDNESLKALKSAVDLGLNFIDTALVYGDKDNHHSEKLIGKFLKTMTSGRKIYIASKINPLNREWPALPDVPIERVFPKEWIYEAVNLSLSNLRIDSLDIMQFHVWQDDFANSDSWKEAIQDITKQGKVKHWGISVNDYEPANCLRTLDTGLISTIQFIFNIFHQEPKNKLFPYAKKNNIGLIARVPLDEGGLTGNITSDTHFDDWRDMFFKGDRKREVYEHAGKLKKLLDDDVTTLPEMALRWLLSHEEVSTVIPGMRTVEHAKENCSVSDKGPLSPTLMKKLKEHVWERNFYN